MATKQIRIQVEDLERLDKLAYLMTIKEEEVINRTEAFKKVLTEGFKVLDKKYPHKGK